MSQSHQWIIFHWFWTYSSPLYYSVSDWMSLCQIMAKPPNVPPKTEHQLGVDHLPTPAVMWNSLIGHITLEYTNMPMPKRWPCIPTPSENAIISLLKKKSKEKQKRQDLAESKAAVQEGNSFPRVHYADKTYCIPSETVWSSLPRWLIEQIFFTRVWPLRVQADKRHKWQEMSGKLQVHRTPMFTHSPLRPS